MKIWMSGDLGNNFADGDIDSVVFTFEPGASQAQVDAAVKVLGHVYPLKVKKVAIDRAPILWEKGSKTAHAKLGNGQGEVMLQMVAGPNGKPVVIQNLKYWGADRNRGFHLYKSTHHYRGHGFDYRFNDANGFMIEIESGSALRHARADARERCARADRAIAVTAIGPVGAGPRACPFLCAACAGSPRRRRSSGVTRPPARSAARATRDP
jgi:hypothetical protein